MNTKNYEISNTVIIKTSWTCPIKCYSVPTIHILFFNTIFYYMSCSKQANFYLKMLLGFLGQASKSYCLNHLNHIVVNIYNFAQVIVLFYSDSIFIKLCSHSIFKIFCAMEENKIFWLKFRTMYFLWFPTKNIISTFAFL